MSNYTVCPIDPIPKIGAFYPEANFLTVGQLCFRRIFQTMRNLRKGTTEMSSEGPKMVGGDMGRPGMAGKHQNPTTQGGDCRLLRRPDPGGSGGGWPINFTGKIASPCFSSLASACARVVVGDTSHGQNSFGLQWVKTTQFGVQGFEEFSLGLWSSK